ncbi:hypothetical protein CDD82_6274 [Ophiocordyceps australis]|uniref:Extracellular membrane protein CFEM domain-containing protein n=1 Tax=Ophiocordyceps australis TaxID=1399860 RepID=A0A2C5YWA1_9HYPO|nr:hypothetical protein CDD82_6274 [Ophiocordyceps australis]
MIKTGILCLCLTALVAATLVVTAPEAAMATQQGQATRRDKEAAAFERFCKKDGCSDNLWNAFAGHRGSFLEFCNATNKSSRAPWDLVPDTRQGERAQLACLGSLRFADSCKCLMSDTGCEEDNECYRGIYEGFKGDLGQVSEFCVATLREVPFRPLEPAEALEGLEGHCRDANQLIDACRCAYGGSPWAVPGATRCGKCYLAIERAKGSDPMDVYSYCKTIRRELWGLDKGQPVPDSFQIPLDMTLGCNSAHDMYSACGCITSEESIWTYPQCVQSPCYRFLDQSSGDTRNFCKTWRRAKAFPDDIDFPVIPGLEYKCPSDADIQEVCECIAPGLGLDWEVPRCSDIKCYRVLDQEYLPVLRGIRILCNMYSSPRHSRRPRNAVRDGCGKRRAIEQVCGCVSPAEDFAAYEEPTNVTGL